MPRSADGLLADEESQLRSPSSDADDGLLRYEPGNTSRCGRRCNKCAGCLRGTWACCGELRKSDGTDTSAPARCVLAATQEMFDLFILFHFMVKTCFALCTPHAAAAADMTVPTADCII